MHETPKTLIEAVRYFADLDVCHAYMRDVKWPDGTIACPKCGSAACAEMRTRPGRIKCNLKACQCQFSYKTDTIFEDSPLGLDKWFVAVWCIANAKNGISSHELGRAIGVTQRTAWFMLHRIRAAMETGTFRKLTGTVESDETFVGGKAENMHKAERERRIVGRGAVGKTAVQGILEREGEVRTFVVPNVKGETLRANVLHNVEPGANVYTDSACAYGRLDRRYTHETVDHAKEWVRGEIHTNGMEGFWALLKRGIFGTWTHVAPFHLFRYCHEQAWRYNHRSTNDGGRFMALLRGVRDRRLTYRRLAALGDCGFMGLE